MHRSVSIVSRGHPQPNYLAVIEQQISANRMLTDASLSQRGRLCWCKRSQACTRERRDVSVATGRTRALAARGRGRRDAPPARGTARATGGLHTWIVYRDVIQGRILLVHALPMNRSRYSIPAWLSNACYGRKKEPMRTRGGGAAGTPPAERRAGEARRIHHCVHVHE